jgi:hypothetical protein
LILSSYEKGAETMPRGKAVTTYARELAKTLSADQLRALSGHLLEHADKPQLDKKAHDKARKAVKTASAKLQNAEETLTVLLADAGRSNSEINEEIRDLRQSADRERVAAPAGAPATPGRRKKAAA